jgi:hypothetical protein
VAQEGGEGTEEPPAEPPTEPAEPAEPAADAEAKAPRPTPERSGDLMIDVGMWVAQPAGLDYQPALSTGDDFLSGTNLLEHEQSTEAEERWTVGYFLPEEIGALEVTYFAHRTESELDQFHPGEPFPFIELWAHPPRAGVNNDQRADGFTSDAETVIRDLRLRFSRHAFSSPKIEGWWFVGWRRVAHQRIASAMYFAISPNLPPIGAGEPRPDLMPLPDIAELESRFDGRGPDLGLDVDFHLWRDRLTLETELSFAVLRGDIQHFYRSLNAAYFTDAGVLNPPYDEAFATPQVVRQDYIEVDLRGNSLSTTSQALEAQIGFRYKVFGWFHAQAGFRSARYDDVGTDIRPESSNIFVYAGTEETDRSATYEGFYLSATFFVF